MFKVGDIVTPNDKFLANWICEKFVYGKVVLTDYDVLELDSPIISRYYNTNKNVSSQIVLVKYMRLVTIKELQIIRKDKLKKICSK